jgi:hypothetical protein
LLSRVIHIDKPDSIIIAANIQLINLKKSFIYYNFI